MYDLTSNLDGKTGIYAVLGDPIYQVQTPRMINSMFAAAETNIYAIPFHVTAPQFEATWNVFSKLLNLVGVGVTIPHKIKAATLCTTLTPTARIVGAVNSVRRGDDGAMHGALFDGTGFINSLGKSKERLRNARVLMVGAGGAGRAIAFALAEVGIGQLDIIDCNSQAINMAIDIVNTRGEHSCHIGAHVAGSWDYDVVINASSIGVKGDAIFPVPASAFKEDMLVADIASLSHETALLKVARAAGASVFDGNMMLEAQMGLIAGFISGLPAGQSLGD